MRGRHPSGPEYVEQLAGSATARQRLKVVLQTLAGTCRVGEACEQLGVGEDRFAQLRSKALTAALEALEPRTAGRPHRQPDPGEDERRQLRERIAELEAQLQVALIRAELAVTLPEVGAAAAKKAQPLPRRERSKRSRKQARGV
ncbi:MAG TPA: helix-turn-helix domain-containing protein [Gemmataceae bacterium]|nr:helix-turn-helix domain-containing protein [Gemmataceae bacterium]